MFFLCLRMLDIVIQVTLQNDERGVATVIQDITRGTLWFSRWQRLLIENANAAKRPSGP